MQEAKITDPSRPKKSEDLFGPIHWQWQSGPNPDPWAEKDASKWSWQDYSPHDSLIIEEAFSLQKETADLGNYEVDFAKMTQVNKQFRNRARRVRRREKSRFLMHIPKPIAVTKEQRRMSQAPGTIQYFLDRMMKTAPEAFGLYQRLKTLKLNSPYTEFEDIIKAVVSCIEKGAEVRERIVKARNSSEKTTFLIEAKKIKETIEGHSQLLGDFLWSVLRVYAMEIFVCYWINEALRSEDWEEIHVLAPFMVCLVYTFKHPEFLITYKEPKGLFKNLKGIVKKPKIRLYKGAALSKEEMERYDRSRIKFFSWSGITSVSRDENVALNFMKKANKLNEQKVTVLFKIKAYFTSPEDHEGIIDLLQNGCSLFRDEQEVILGPGTVFKLRKTKWLEADILQVNLKLKKSFKEKKENNVPLLENVQEEKAISEDKAIIDGLPSQQSLNLLEKLKGNKMIRKLEIRNSGIDDSIMKEIESLRASTKTAKEDVRFVNNTIIIGDLGYFAGYLSIANANRILTSNKIRFKEGEISKDAASEIKTLVLSEESLQNFKQTNQLKELSAKITSAPKIESLDLKLPNSEFTDFLQCIGEAKGLKSLRLKINKENFMERRGFEILCQAIKQSNTLGQLSLDLSLSDGEFSFLKETLESLHPIPELSLDLRFCDKVSDEGLNHLKNGLISLSSLENLSLEFLKCNNISDKGLNNLRGCFSALTSLQNLSLNFAGCSNLSDEGLHYLKVGMVSIPSLPRLSLNFAECSKISDEGLNQLKRGLLSFSHLRLLSLNFKRCNKISDKGLNILKSGLTVLTSLQNLSLSFDECFNISYEGFGYIKESILKNLQNLSLSFENCSEIPIEALSDLKSVVIELKSLKNLSLSFAYCKNISDKGLNEIKSCLESLPSLQSLSLSFAGCNDISDEGLERLKDGLLGLKSLQHLSLNFAGCDRVSDEGLGHLKEGFKGLTKIELLSLSFDNCSKVSDMGISHLKSGIISLPALQNLSLNFKRCNKVSDQGLNHVKSAVISVPLLRHLCLNFKNCWQISDEGLGRLRDGFKKMAALQYLALNIQGCEKVSEKERTKFCDELKDIPSLSFE